MGNNGIHENECLQRFYKDKRKQTCCFHVSWYTHDQERILSSFLSNYCVVKLITCTVTYGIAVDIRKTFPWNIYPITPHFYIQKTGIPNVFIFDPKQRLWVLVRTASPPNQRFVQKYQFFSNEIINFCFWKNLCILHGQVFVMQPRNHIVCISVLSNSHGIWTVIWRNWK